MASKIAGSVMALRHGCTAVRSRRLDRWSESSRASGPTPSTKLDSARRRNGRPDTYMPGTGGTPPSRIRRPRHRGGSRRARGRTDGSRSPRRSCRPRTRSRSSAGRPTGVGSGRSAGPGSAPRRARRRRAGGGTDEPDRLGGDQSPPAGDDSRSPDPAIVPCHRPMPSSHAIVPCHRPMPSGHAVVPSDARRRAVTRCSALRPLPLPDPTVRFG